MIGCVVERGGQRHGRFDMSAARAELARPAERDERAVDGRIGRFVEQSAGRFLRFPPHSRRHAPARHPKHPRLLFPIQFRAVFPARGFRWLR